MAPDGIGILIPEGIVAAVRAADLQGIERLVGKVRPSHEIEGLGNSLKPEPGSLEVSFLFVGYKAHANA